MPAARAIHPARRTIRGAPVFPVRGGVFCPAAARSGAEKRRVLPGKNARDGGREAETAAGKVAFDKLL